MRMDVRFWCQAHHAGSGRPERGAVTAPAPAGTVGAGPAPERLGTPTHCSTRPQGSILPEAAVAPPLVHLPAPQDRHPPYEVDVPSSGAPPRPFLRPCPVFAVRGPSRDRSRSRPTPQEESHGVSSCGVACRRCRVCGRRADSRCRYGRCSTHAHAHRRAHPGRRPRGRGGGLVHRHLQGLGGTGGHRQGGEIPRRTARRKGRPHLHRRAPRLLREGGRGAGQAAGGRSLRRPRGGRRSRVRPGHPERPDLGPGPHRPARSARRP